MKAIGYIRYNENADMAIVEETKARIEKYMLDHGYENHGIRIDCGNGNDNKRVEINRIVSEAGSSAFDTVLIDGTHHLSRDVQFLYKIIETLNNHGVTVICIRDGTEIKLTPEAESLLRYLSKIG